MTIRQLIEKYESDRSSYLRDQYNETLLRSDFLDPLFELLGWDIKNHAGKSTNEREVILEESLKANASEHSKKPDYTFRLFSERKFFLEAKKPRVQIQSSDETARQIRRYGFTAKLKISVLSNFEYLMIYDVSVKVDPSDNYQKALIKKYHYTEYEAKFEEIKNFLSKDSVYSGQFDSEWKDIEAKIQLYSIDNLFLNQINEWRILLGAEIFKYDPTITSHQLNDTVQSYLNRILFLRVCEDRNLEEYQTLLKFASANDFAALIRKFQQADKRYNSGLFDQLLVDRIIENVSSVFWNVIKQLYYPESPYSFAVFSSDVLGTIYEIFLSEQLIIDGSVIKLIKKPENADRDIITTPTFIITDILRKTVQIKCHDKSYIEICNLKFADISCGSGAFLLELYQLLNDNVIDYFLKTDKSKLLHTGFENYKLPFEIKRNILLNCIYGVDKDYNAVESAKFGLLLKILENEDSLSISVTNPILPSLDQNIFFGNSLIAPKQVFLDYEQTIINPFDFGNLRFDVIVGNPPYMKSEDMKNLTPLELPIYKEDYISAHKQFDKYFLFIERGLYLLRDGGLLGYIVPSKFTKVGAASKLRNVLSSNGYLYSLVSFGANQIFTDKTTYTSILVLSKERHEKFTYTEIKNLAQWKIRDYQNITTDEIDSNTLSNDLWFLVPPYLKHIYDQIINQSESLEQIVGEDNINNGIQTSANDVFIIQATNEEGNLVYFEKKGITYSIEKTVLKPYYITQRKKGEDKLNTYRTIKPNAYVIFPYIIEEGKSKFIYPTEFKNLYPKAYEYLEANKPRLTGKRDVKPIPKTDQEWYRFGRSQYLELGEIKEKIILGVMSTGEKYPIDFSQTLHTAGGTAGYCSIYLSENNPYSIYYIQAILNSKYVEWIIFLKGEVFRGGYIARGTKLLKDLPIRKIDFEDTRDKMFHDEIVKKQKQLIQIQHEMDSNSGNKRILMPLASKFGRIKIEMDNLLKSLFGLNDDDAFIPTIKELYEIN